MANSAPQCLEDLIDAFGSLKEFGEICGYPKNPAARGSEIKSTGLLPVVRWPLVIAEAKARRIPGVDAAFLLRIYTDVAGVPSARSA